MGKSAANEFYRFTEEFLTRVRLLGESRAYLKGDAVHVSADGWPKRTAFYRYLRKQVHIGGEEKYFKAMKESLAVPKRCIEAALTYFDDQWGGCEVTEFDAVTERAERKDASDTFDPFSKRGGWLPLADRLRKKCRLDETCRCATREEVFLAADEVLRCVGRHILGRNATDEQERTLGEERTHRTVADYGEFYRRWWVHDDRTVLRSSAGVTVVCPLSELQYREFRTGKFRDDQMVPDAAVGRTPWVLINAFADAKIGGVRAKAQASVKLIEMLLSQFAWFFPQLSEPGIRPHIITYGGTKKNAERIHIYGGQRTETYVPAINMPILELIPNQRVTVATLQQQIAYLTAMTTIQAWQSSWGYDENRGDEE